MYKNCDRFKFRDVILTLISGPVFTFASKYCQIASFFITGHFNWKKNNDFWAVGKCCSVVCEVSYWQKKITI